MRKPKRHKNEIDLFLNLIILRQQCLDDEFGCNFGNCIPLTSRCNEIQGPIIFKLLSYFEEFSLKQIFNKSISNTCLVKIIDAIMARLRSMI